MSKKLGIREFNKYIRKELKKEILDRYLHYQILSEADLQYQVCKLISSFLNKYDKEWIKYKVVNKPYLKGLGIHPDLVVFRRETPWVVIELKEGKILKSKSAKKERKRLLKSRKAFSAKRGYLLYTTRYGDEKALKGHKGKGARFFFEIPIVLETILTKERIVGWERDFRKWAKYSDKE